MLENRVTKLIIGLVLIVLLGGLVFALTRYKTGVPGGANNPTTGSPIPRFEDYKASRVFTGPVHALDEASDPQAATYRTALTRALTNEGVNFAGHYTAVLIGCGSNCANLVIVDAVTGKASFPNITAELGASFEKDSHLIIINPESHELPLAMRSENQLPMYYIWDGTSLRLIYRQTK